MEEIQNKILPKPIYWKPWVKKFTYIALIFISVCLFIMLESYFDFGIINDSGSKDQRAFWDVLLIFGSIILGIIGTAGLIIYHIAHSLVTLRESKAWKKKYGELLG